MNETTLESMILISFKGVDPPPHRDEIAKRARELATVLGVDVGTLDEIVKRVETNLVTTMDEGVSLVDIKDNHDEDWVVKKENIVWNYWKDYERHLAGVGWGPKIIHAMGEVTNNILGLLKDPETLGEWDRRGLVIGHVQSGKTANYIGLIAKAADAGYRFIIVIAGIHNNLRKQTQRRIDEGFIGRDGETRKPVGVGEMNKIREFPIPLTNTASDFSKKFASANMADLGAYDRPVILVIKKHVLTLGNVYSWLKELNADQAGQISKIPMLLIDDEADNASINTNKPELNPTRTNEEIRSLLKLFRKSCYVGYTGTPFANIFIDPNDEAEMIGDDLFPRNFIYCLDAPTNYFGAHKVFMDEETSDRVLRTIDDAEDYIPFAHKKNDEISELPPSAKDAIKTFILTKSIRCIRNQKNRHSSMLINVSRFVDVQRQIKELTAHYLSEIKDAIRYNYRKSVQDAQRNVVMSELKVVFDKEFKDCPEKWGKVQARLFEASDEIKTYLVNSRSDEALDYGKYAMSGDALNAIAIGGLSLSRGLTLEGLTVSYMYRNTKMYDTLMQMSRWFGYRLGYDDLCRVWLSDDSQGWYAHIAEATEDLRRQVRQMRRDGFSPRKFGLYVRAHPDALLVTALNKMRKTERRTFNKSFDGVQQETHIIPASEESRTNNLSEMVSLFKLLNSDGIGTRVDTRNGVVWREVPVKYIIDFMSNFRFHRMLQGEKEAFLSYTREVSDTHDTWDIAFISLVETTPAHDVLPMAVQQRQIGRNANIIKLTKEEPGWYVGNKQKVSGRGVERIGLYPDEIDRAEKSAKNNKREQPDDKDFRDARGCPLLMLHLLELFNEVDCKKDIIAKMMPAVGFSFPATNDTRSVECVVNQVWLENEMIDSPDEEDDYDS